MVCVWELPPSSRRPSICVCLSLTLASLIQWYCRFFAGRRCSDDVRQIQRWGSLAGPKGRFRSQMCGKIVNAGKTAGDGTVSPVVRQTLHHWGLEITEEIVTSYKKAKGIK